jgi:hypothetical protein
LNKQTSLSAGLKAAAGKAPANIEQPEERKSSERSIPGSTVLVGAHYDPQVRRALLLVQAQPGNERKTLKRLLGEAINDLCAKYRQPEPYTGEE